MRFTWVDVETGEKDENLFGANGQNDWDKGVGSALTYAERYFLLKYFHIATDEDDIDNPERKPEETQQPAATPPAQTQAPQPTTIDIPRLQARIKACTTLEELQKAWNGLTADEKTAVTVDKEEKKKELTPKK